MYSSNRIEHISDQLTPYAYEVADAVIKIQNSYKFSDEIAVQVVKIAAMEHIADALHHAEGQINDVVDSIYSISKVLE